MTIGKLYTLCDWARAREPNDASLVKLLEALDAAPLDDENGNPQFKSDGSPYTYNDFMQEIMWWS